jgi:hypothetical protein
MPALDKYNTQRLRFFEWLPEWLPWLARRWVKTLYLPVVLDGWTMTENQFVYIYFYSMLGKSSNFLWISNWENHPRSGFSSGFSSLDPIRSAIELMKQKQDYGHWYDRQKILVKDIGNTQRPGTK